MLENKELPQDTKIIIRADADLEPLMPGFLKNRQRDLETITTALADGDFETVMRVGHSLKGVGAGYGFDYITEIGDLLERAAKHHERLQISDYV